MDRKLSDFPVAPEFSLTDLIPIVSGGLNKLLTVGVLLEHTPNFSNKGITKNLVTPAQGFVVPLNKTLLTVSFAGSYQVPAGVDGQEITIVSFVPVTILSGFATFQSVGMGINSTLTLIFISTINKWVIKSSYQVTIIA